MSELEKRTYTAGWDYCQKTKIQKNNVLFFSFVSLHFSTPPPFPVWDPKNKNMWGVDLSIFCVPLSTLVNTCVSKQYPGGKSGRRTLSTALATSTSSSVSLPSRRLGVRGIFPEACAYSQVRQRHDTARQDTTRHAKDTTGRDAERRHTAGDVRTRQQVFDSRRCMTQ